MFPWHPPRDDTERENDPPRNRLRERGRESPRRAERGGWARCATGLNSLTTFQPVLRDETSGWSCRARTIPAGPRLRNTPPDVRKRGIRSNVQAL